MMPIKIVIMAASARTAEMFAAQKQSASNLLQEHQDRGPVFGLHFRLSDKSGASIGATRAAIVERGIDGDNGRAFRQQPLGKMA